MNIEKEHVQFLLFAIYTLVTDKPPKPKESYRQLPVAKAASDSSVDTPFFTSYRPQRAKQQSFKLLVCLNMKKHFAIDIRYLDSGHSSWMKRPVLCLS